MARRWKGPWDWGAESRWKFYAVGSVAIGGVVSVIEIVTFYCLLGAREIWAYAMVVFACPVGGLITSIVMYPIMKALGFVR